MASFEIKEANILTKILFLNQYLEKIDSKDLKNGVGVSKDKINENELVELSSEFEESFDTEKLEEAIEKLYSVMNLDESKGLSNAELLKFKGILDEIGLTSGEILELYNKYEKEVSDDVNVVDITDIENINQDKFKEMISQYPKLQEVIEEIGYDKFFDLVDTNNDGTLSSDELGTISSSDETIDKLTYDDIQKLIKDNDLDITDNKQAVEDDIEYTELIGKLKDSLGLNNPIEENPVQSTIPTNSGGYSGGGSYGSGGGGSTSSSGGAANNSGSQANGLGSSETIEQLEQEKSTKESSLSTKQLELEEIINGTNSELMDYKELEETAEEEYNDLLKTVCPELQTQWVEVQNDIKSTEEEIAENELETEKTKYTLNSLDIELSSINGNISATQNAIKSLKSTDTSGLSSDKQSEITKRISELNDTLSDLEDAKGKIEDSIDSEEDNLSNLEGELETLQDNLGEYEEKLATIKAEIAKLNNADLTAAKAKLDGATADYKAKQEELKADAQDEIESLQTDIKTLQSKIDEKTNEEIEALGTVSSMEGTFTLKGQTYNTIIDGNVLKTLESKIQNAGAGTKWGHADKCLSFAYTYGEWANGKSSISINGNAAANYPDASKYTKYESSTKEGSLSMIAQQLNEGNPVVLQVNGSNHGSYYGRHFVTVVGLREGASNPPTESDLLIIDSYDGKIEGMGKYGTRFMTAGSTTKANDYGYRLYIRK